MLLCNPSRSPEEQKQLLHNILFVDAKNPRYWNQYLTYLADKYPQKKDSLITLVFKALSVIPEAPNKDQPDFIRLHLRLAGLDQYVRHFVVCVNVLSHQFLYGLLCGLLLRTGQPIQARQRYRIMQKRGIGSRSAEFFVQYAQFEQEQSQPTTAKRVLECGMSAHAEPRHLLIHALDNLRQQYPESASNEESNADLNRSTIDPGTDKIEFRVRTRVATTAPSATPRSKAVALEDEDVTRPLAALQAEAPTSASASSAVTPRVSTRQISRKRKEEEATPNTKPVKRMGEFEHQSQQHILR